MKSKILSFICFMGLAAGTLAFAPKAAGKADNKIRSASKAVAISRGSTANRSFVIEGDRFLKDGRPFVIHAGTSHYWRRMPEYWEDTMIKLKAMGLNALETYISWNLHEPEQETYSFEGAVDIVRYLRLAHKHGLLVVLRPGPYINAEMDLGGLPYWLLRENASMALRTSDPLYMKFVKRYFHKLLPMLKPLLYANGGPVVMVQVENEYGSYHACDHDYLLSLRDLSRQLLGPSVILFTTDGNSQRMLQCGPVAGTFAAIDFGAGSNVSTLLKNYRKYFPTGPFFNTEFYPGWINHWGFKRNVVLSSKLVFTMKDMLRINASFVVYPALGGTNFGFLLGPNVFSDTFFPGTTSYDFDAPLNEAGDPTEKFTAIRDTFKEFGYIPPSKVPEQSPKTAYGTVHMSFAGTIFDNLDRLSPEIPVASDLPKSFEQLGHPHGFVLYRTAPNENVTYLDPTRLNVTVLHDRAYIFVDQQYVGILSRTSNLTAANIAIRKNQTLDILVQNEGRVTYGSSINDSKGILGPVYLSTDQLFNWTHYPVKLPSYPVRNPVPLNLTAPTEPRGEDFAKAAFFTGTFPSSPAQSTFLDLTGWRQGYAFINGYNLGRYWPAFGPFVTLYVPGAMLKASGDNILQLFELSGSPCNVPEKCSVKFVENHIITQSEIMEP